MPTRQISEASGCDFEFLGCLVVAIQYKEISPKAHVRFGDATCGCRVIRAGGDTVKFFGNFQGARGDDNTGRSSGLKASEDDESVESVRAYSFSIRLHQDVLDIGLLASQSRNISSEPWVVGVHSAVVKNELVTGRVHLISNFGRDTIAVRHVRLNGGTDEDGRAIEGTIALLDESCGEETITV
jgi:hypothetical protein